jgi:NAD(P)-dependent dehydrogenase (short-subunit alcohol dehydrogenase family)
MPERFSGKVAFVTGGTGALGRVVSAALYTEGAALAITHLHDEQAASLPEPLKSEKTKLALFKTDVTDEEQIKSAFRRAVDRFGAVDYLLNIAGGYMGKTPIEQLQLKDWDYMLDLNLKSAFLCSREALKIMRKNGHGRIINISAMAALSPTAGRGAYGISKAAVVTLTRLAAEEVKGTDITVNVIAPSVIVTEANVRSSPDADYSKWVKPEEVAELILYLCSDGARSINGALIEVKGGF